MQSIWWSSYPDGKFPLVLSAWTAAKAPTAAPQADETELCPSRSTLPTTPYALTPTCGAKRITMFPSFAQWLLKAPQPVLPVNGNPAKPANGKISPHLF